MPSSRSAFESPPTNRPIKLQFKDQSDKFFPNHRQDSHAHTHYLETATRSRQSSTSDVERREAETALTLPRLSEPDPTVHFYLAHYASMGRDLGSSRGFFEMLLPAYMTQPQGSPLALALSTLASEVLSAWRQDPSSFRTPRQSYSRAITRLRTAIQDPVERCKPSTVLAVLVLQTYENACAVFDLRWASSTHHQGAASLLSLVDVDDTDVVLRAYLHKFMLHTEVSTAIRLKQPLRNAAYYWIGSGATIGVPDLLWLELST